MFGEQHPPPGTPLQMPTTNPAMMAQAAAAAQSSTPPPQNVAGMQAYKEVANAILHASGGNQTQYVAETKKVCLAMMEADEIVRTSRRRNESIDPVQALRHELQVQVSAFALMRALPADKVKEAADKVNQNYFDGLTETPPQSAAYRLVLEMEKSIDSKPLQEKVSEGLMVQPLFRVMAQAPELIDNLGTKFQDCVPFIPQLLHSANSSLGMLLKASNPPPV